MTFNEMIKQEFNLNFESTLWDDFAIADAFGKDAVIDTYKRVIKEWIDNLQMMIELTFVLNHRCCMHYNRGKDIWELYSELYYMCKDKCIRRYKGDKLSKYLNTID